MKQSIISVLLVVCMLPACSSNNLHKSSDPDQNTSTSTFLIQAISNSVDFTRVIKQTAYLANAIVKQELGLSDDYNFNFFIPKRMQRVTLYYCNNLQLKELEVMLDGMYDLHFDAQSLFAGLTEDIDFFGDQKDELVLLIDDATGQLAGAHEAIKHMMHVASNEYQKVHSELLYDIAKSERYPFKPHMGIGRLRIQSIKQRLDGKEDVDVIIERIKEKILLAVQQVVKELCLHNREIIFTNIMVLDLSKRAYLGEYFCFLQSKQ